MPTKYEGSEKEILALNTFIKLNRAAESLAGRLLQRQTLGDLSVSQFGVLEALYHLGPMCQNELGQRILKSSGNMTMVIDNLEKKHAVVRRRSEEDRRKVVVSLTDEGRAVVKGLLPGHVAAITDELSLLSPEEQRQLGDLCRKLGTAGTP